MASTNNTKGVAAMTATPNIFDKISAYVAKYVQVKPDELRVISLWVLHTWAFSGQYTRPLTTPYLYIFSAERRSGKTRLLETLEQIIRNPLRAADVTSAVLFRAIESLNPTIMLDEVDAIWSGAKNEELRGVLNAGYKRGGFTLRVVNNEPTQFNVFGPKALAGIDNAMLPDTVRDRCIPIAMHRQAAGTSTPFYSYDVEDEANALVEEIQQWMDTHYEKLCAINRPAPIEGMGDRAWEISMPLVMLAQAFGAKFTKDTRAALLRLLTAEEKLTPGAQLLSDIRDMFDNANQQVLAGAEIVAKLNEDGGSWTGKLVASRLYPFGVKPTTIRDPHTKQVQRGYRRQDFKAAWEAYLP